MSTAAGAPPLDGGECVRVVVRVRPLSESELSAGREAVVSASAERKEIAIGPGGAAAGGGAPRTFTFDDAYGETSTQADVYASAAAPIVESVLAGFNGTIFACAWRAWSGGAR